MLPNLRVEKLFLRQVDSLLTIQTSNCLKKPQTPRSTALKIVEIEYLSLNNKEKVSSTPKPGWKESEVWRKHELIPLESVHTCDLIAFLIIKFYFKHIKVF